MDSFRTSTYQKVHQIGNLEERLFPSTGLHRSLKPHSMNYRVDAVHKEVHEYIQGRLKLLCKIHNISVGRTVTPLEIRIWPHQGEAGSSREQRWEKQRLKPCSEERTITWSMKNQELLKVHLKAPGELIKERKGTAIRSWTPDWGI